MLNNSNLITDLFMIMPQLTIFLTVLINIFIIVFAKKEKDFSVYISSVVGLFLATIMFFFLNTDVNYTGFWKTLALDKFSLFFCVIISIGGLVSLLISRKPLVFCSKFKGEFYTFFLCAILGALFLVQSIDLVSIFVSLEFLSISSFFLIGFFKDENKSNEAVLKYFVTSCLTTAIMLYGFSFLYGITSETKIIDILNILINQNLMMTPLSVLAFILIFAAIAFKTSLFPFHMWTSDVYKGAPICVAMFLSIVSKFAGFALLLKFLPFSITGIFVIYVIAIFTIIIGNLLAIRENDIKKFMAYSTIAQAGFILAGFCIYNNGFNLSSAFFYMTTYLVMNIGAWCAVELIMNKTGYQKIENFAGLAYVNAPVAFCLMLCMISLAGLPITAGFWAKFYLLKSIFFAGEIYWVLFLVVLFNTILGVFYYTKLIRTMYLKPINRELIKRSIIKFSPMSSCVLVICCLWLLLVGFCPNILKDFTDNYSVINYQIENKI